MLRKLVQQYSKRARFKRAQFFRAYLSPSEKDKILDLGGGNGSHISKIIPYRRNVYIADIYPTALKQAEELYGFQTILLDEGGKLPFPDDFFDIVFCSSAIEHVTVSKKRLRQYRTNQEFYKASYQRQVGFAEELRRVGKRYFVQTPYKYFLIESHTWMPGIIVLFPRIWQIKLIDFLNKWWPKKASPDWHLLTKKQMQALFPDAKIIFEKSFGLPKSLLAIKYTESN